MSDGGHIPTDPAVPPAPADATDGARLVALVGWNVRARRAAGHAAEAAGDATPIDAARCRQHADREWLALVRESHGTALSHVHVHQFYNRVLLSLRRAPADPDAAAGLQQAVDGADDHEVLQAFAGAAARAGVPAVPLELTRDFFDRLRRRERPWRDEGDDKFHRYLARSAKWLAVAHKRRVGLLPGRARPAARPRPDARRVRDAMVDALLAPAVLAALADAPWLSDGVRAVLRRQLAAARAQGGPLGGAPRPVPPTALRGALTEALDRLAADVGYAPPLAPVVEALAGPLLRSRVAWDRPWAAWCSELDPDVLRTLAGWRLAGAPLPAPAALGTRDPRMASLPAGRLAAAAPAVCEAVLPAVLAHVAAVLTEAYAVGAALGDPLSGAIAEDARAGLTGAQIATRRGITTALVYKRLERLRRLVAASLARTLAGPGRVPGPVPGSPPPTRSSDG